MYAAMFDRIETVEALLEHGARVDRTDHGGRSALEHALAMGAAPAAERLRRATAPA
jgi:ankyrin repeat protein